MKDIRYYLPGSLLILAAMLIVAVPEILIAFTAASIAMAGIAALMVGHGLRKAEGAFDRRYGAFVFDTFGGFRDIRSPLYRKYFH